MARSEQFIQGERHGVKWAIEFLHQNARQMNDYKAVLILNRVASEMGNAFAKQGKSIELASEKESRQ